VTNRRLRLGVAGLGRAFALMLPGLVAHPGIQLAAGADPRPEARARFGADFGARTYETVEQLCADADVEAVYVASPHQFHVRHATLAAENGKHLLIEKPMALSLDECRAMIEAAARAGVAMVIGHSHSFDAPIARTRTLIASGAYGRLRMITAMNFTDFLYRPRRPEELRTEAGGGVVFNQAPHHIDTVRLLGGGLVKSVRALTGSWDPARPTEGAYAALLTFEDGAFASLVYSGYAHFDSDVFVDWIAESGLPKDRDVYGAARSRLRQERSADQELALKAELNYGGQAAPPRTPGSPWHQQFGVLIASCERADLRPLPNGVEISGDVERSFEPLAAPEIPRKEVLDELCEAVFHGRPPLHNGEWGLATMEACLAILESARRQRDVALRHQVPVP
jgi:phthalate 4,5-cis-dihydrodiol dehydrogenase